MEYKKKPKCRGCGTVGTDEYYYWQKNTTKRSHDEPDGYLWHLDCSVEVHKGIKKYEKES